VLAHFSQRNIGLVVRLNDALYSSSYFTALGMQHLEMMFDDGTCPTLPVVRKFIRLAHEMITVKKKGIAVHCKAGLGRTGCLIGAYLIYRHGFTANEIIAYMRFMRPGMVVGPQQHWLHLNQGQFREWWYDDSHKEKMALLAPATPPRGSVRNRMASNGQTYTPPNGSQRRAALGEITHNEQSPLGTSVNGSDESVLPAPTPGQPRKTSKAYGRTKGAENSEPYVLADTEIVSMQTHVEDASGSEDELQVRMLLRRASRTPGTASRDKRRTVSCTTAVGVRKVSGRVGSMGSGAATAAAKAKS
jgi:cell division cycle 14